VIQVANHACKMTAKILSWQSPDYKYLLPHERFLLRPAKSFFKELFLRNPRLSNRLKIMSKRSGIIKGLKDQECEKGAISRRPPIACVPVTNEVQEQLNSNLSGKRMEKLTMLDGVTFHVGIWYSGTPEQFLLHVKQAMHSVKQAGLVDEYYSAHKKCIAAHANWDKAVTSIVNYKKKNKEDGPFRDYEAVLKELKKEQDAFLKAQTEAEAERIVLADSIFTQYANLLSVEQ
jgi:hypothetical protein